MRQYIGARYVPKFMGPYDATQAYEALCVVDNGQGTSYISKVPTPANTPLTDTDYWAIYGASSGAIISLQDQINDMNDGTVPGSLQNQIDDLDSQISNLSARKFIIISDSYGLRTVNWIDRLVATLGLTSSDYYTSSVNGAGFAFGTTFEAQLTTLAASISDKDAITDIIVGGGFNDRSVAPATVKSAIASFVSYAKTTFKNAKVHIGFIGWSFNSEFISELVVNNVLNTYKQCEEYGASYIVHSDEVMHDSALFEQEPESPYTLFLGYQYVHPSAAGAQAIANCIANYVLTGVGVSYDAFATVTPTLASGVTITSGSLDLIMRKSGNNIAVGKMYNLTVLSFANGVNLNGGTIDLGMLESGLAAGIATTNASIKPLTFMPVVGFANYGGINAVINAMLLIANNHLYLHTYLDGATNVTQIGLFGCAGHFDTNEI